MYRSTCQFAIIPLVQQTIVFATDYSAQLFRILNVRRIEKSIKRSTTRDSVEPSKRAYIFIACAICIVVATVSRVSQGSILLFPPIWTRWHRFTRYQLWDSIRLSVSQSPFHFHVVTVCAIYKTESIRYDGYSCRIVLLVRATCNVYMNIYMYVLILRPTIRNSRFVIMKSLSELREIERVSDDNSIISTFFNYREFHTIEEDGTKRARNFTRSIRDRSTSRGRPRDANRA